MLTAITQEVRTRCCLPRDLPSEEGGVVPSGVAGVVGAGLTGVVTKPISG